MWGTWTQRRSRLPRFSHEIRFGSLIRNGKRGKTWSSRKEIKLKIRGFWRSIANLKAWLPWKRLMTVKIGVVVSMRSTLMLIRVYLPSKFRQMELTWPRRWIRMFCLQAAIQACVKILSQWLPNPTTKTRRSSQKDLRSNLQTRSRTSCEWCSRSILWGQTFQIQLGTD